MDKLQTPEELVNDENDIDQIWDIVHLSGGPFSKQSARKQIVEVFRSRDTTVRAPLIETLEYVRPQLANMETVFRDWGWEAFSRDLGKSIAKVDAALEAVKRGDQLREREAQG